MPIDDKATVLVARLARLALSDDEIASYRSDLDRIFGWIDQLRQIDVKDVDPVYNVCGFTLPERADKVSSDVSHDALMANAPAHKDGFFLVPQVISHENE